MNIIEDLRKYRIYNMAIFDWIVSISFFVIISLLLQKPINLNLLLKIIIIIFPLSILIHKLFKINTNLVNMFDKNFYIQFLFYISILYILYFNKN